MTRETLPPVFGGIGHEDFPSDNGFLSHVEDMVASLGSSMYAKRHLLVKFYFDASRDQVLYLIFCDRAKHIGRVNTFDGRIPLTGGMLDELYQEYKTVFRKTREMNTNVSNGKVDDSALCKRAFSIWNKLFRQFVEPIEPFIDSFGSKEVIYSFQTSKEGMELHLNLPMVYDLSIRYLNRRADLPAYFSWATHSSMYEHLKSASLVKFPKGRDICMLYGFDEEKIKDQETLYRELLADRILKLCRQGGGEASFFDDKSQFYQAIGKDSNKPLVMLIGHFHNRMLKIRNRKIIDVDDIVAKVSEMAKNEQLHRHVTLNAMTCDNFEDFGGLKEAGLKIVHFSHQALDTILAFFTAYELLSGDCARELGFPLPYLNGLKHFPQAWSEATRVLYLTMNSHGFIKLPIFMQTQTVTVYGDQDLSDFAAFLKDNQSGGQMEFESMATDRPADNSKMDGFEIGSVILTAATAQITKMIVEYLIKTGLKLIIERLGSSGKKEKKTFDKNNTEEVQGFMES